MQQWYVRTNYSHEKDGNLDPIHQMVMMNTMINNKKRLTKKQRDAYMGFSSILREDVMVARFPEECMNTQCLLNYPQSLEETRKVYSANLCMQAADNETNCKLTSTHSTTPTQILVKKKH
jgi:hypothetical protein